MKRGDVVVAAAGGTFGRKARPYVIVQSDDRPTPLVILVGCTTSGEASLPFRPKLTPSATNGLRDASDVMVDIPITSRRDKVGKIIGLLDDAEMASVDRGLLVILGLVAE